jgi:hypothetical protein
MARTSHEARRPDTERPVRAEGASREEPADHESRERVARQAFELFERRGGEHGHDLADWLEAERLVSAERLAGRGETRRRIP